MPRQSQRPDRANAAALAVPRRGVLLGGLALLAACGLPQQGPDAADVLAGAEARDFLLLEVDAAIVARLGTPRRSGLGGMRASASDLPSQAVGQGDVLHVRVLEAGAGGLFATGDGGAGGTDFASVVVDRDGRISLPYVGEIDVQGDTPAQIQQKIVEKLQGKAIEPQALVSVLRSENNRATVAGDVAVPGAYALSLRGDRVSQAIAASGGSRHPAHETRVSLVRNGRAASAYLSDILLVPGNDVALQRDDLVVLTHEPPRFTLTGSVPRPGTYPFDTVNYSVLEAGFRRRWCNRCARRCDRGVRVSLRKRRTSARHRPDRPCPLSANRARLCHGVPLRSEEPGNAISGAGLFAGRQGRALHRQCAIG